MPLPIIKILEYLFQATPIIHTASELVKKMRKETNNKIQEVESSLEYKVKILEKKFSEQVKINHEIAEQLEVTNNALIKMRKSAMFVMLLAVISFIMGTASLIVILIR